MIALVWWEWLLLGVGLLLLELLFPSVWLLWLGLSAVLVAVASVVLELPREISFLLWGALLVLLLMGGVKWRQVQRRRTQTPEQQAIGVQGVLLEDMSAGEDRLVLFQEPVLGERRQKVISDDVIAAGERVHVVSLTEGKIKVARTLLTEMAR